MYQKLTAQFPSQGWRQILTSRKEMLDAYDRARDQAKIHEIETFHGNAAEAAFRSWLSGFLPKRYSVAKGYVVSAGLKGTDKTPHFDVIIYDRLESPVLWVEETADTSKHGRSLAIPVEYVRAVIEVKSQFSKRTVKDAINHLADLLPVMGGPDHPQERYKLHLPSTFCCGLAFFELRREEAYSQSALAEIINGIKLRGFFGGVVLRAEGHTSPNTGRISLTQSQTPVEITTKEQQTPLSEFGLAQSVQFSEHVHIGSMIFWSELGFAQFAFDLIAMMQGTYEPGRLSSLYGIGSSFTEIMLEARARPIEG